MRCACIDIGSNTTRLLVAEPDAARGAPRELAAERVFTAIAAAVGADGRLPARLIAEVVEVVEAQAATAHRHGAQAVRTVATAAVRRAPNSASLVAALRAAGVELEILSGEQEARLTFAGATAAVPGRGAVAVVDVGGGSTEVAVGRGGDEPAWWASLPAGSSTLTGSCVRHDPPTAACLAALAAAAVKAFADVSPPPAEVALAVGGSATSLLLLGAAGRPPDSNRDAGLDAASLRRALTALTADTVAATALRLGLHPERVRVLPGGISLLARACVVFDAPFQIARGGLREGVILELLRLA